MTNEPFDDNFSPRTESNPDRSAAGDDLRDDPGAPGERDRHERKFCIPAPGGIFVNPQLSIDPQPHRSLPHLGPIFESKFHLKKAKTQSPPALWDSPPTLGIDDFCC